MLRVVGVFASALILSAVCALFARADDQLVLPTFVADESAGSLDLGDPFGAAATLPSGSTGGGGGSSHYDKYYDLTIKVLNTSTHPGDSVFAELTIDFVPLSIPPDDGILVYSIIAPDGITYSPSQEALKEGDHVRTLSYLVPSNAPSGHWTFTATWTVPDLAPITAKQQFTVERQSPVSFVTTKYPIGSYNSGAVVSGVIILGIMGLLVAAFVVGISWRHARA